jgi:hypothetical protein
VKVLWPTFMTDTERQRMSELCTAIVSEYDPQKMMKLVRDLNVLLDAKQERLERKQAEAR